MAARSSIGIVLASAVALNGCALYAHESAPSLVATVPEPAGPNCASGGYAIETGRDTNDNGVLDPSEVTSIVYVCAPTTPPRELVAVVPEPAGAHCATGGQAVEIGLDGNDDGVLQPNEISSISYVCSGAPGVQTLVAVVTEPPGPNCSLGGEAIEVGADVDHDGVLEPAEVTSTSYVCSVEGARTLVRVDPESPGANCSAGGNAIRVGFDDNDDGILEDGEVDSTTYLCGPPVNPTTIDGDVIINNSLDVAQLDGVTAITGNMTIASSTLSTISLPNLQRIGGTLACGPCPQLASLSLPALSSVYAIDLRNHAVATIVFANNLVPASSGLLALGSIANSTLPLGTLTSASLQIDSAPNLTSLSLDSLTIGGVTVGDAPQLASLSLQSFQSGTVSIGDDALAGLSLPVMTDGTIMIGSTQLSSFSAPNLTHARVLLTGQLRLTSLDLPNLQSGDVSVSGADALTAISVPKLMWQDESGVAVIAATSLTTLDLPVMQFGNVQISGCTSLTSFSAPVLAQAYRIQIDTTPMLAQLTLPTLAQSNDLFLEQNATLSSVSIPLLYSGQGSFYATDNPMLPTCMARALAAQGHWHASTTFISGDDDTATCP